MDRTKYLKEVKRRLKLPAEMKSEILRSLEESLDCADESGEEFSRTVERIGKPADFARDIMQSVELTADEKRRTKRARAFLFAFLIFSVAAVCATLSFAVPIIYMKSRGAIGYADAPTQIAVASAARINAEAAVCAFLWAAAAAAFILRLIVKRKRAR